MIQKVYIGFYSVLLMSVIIHLYVIMGTSEFGPGETRPPAERIQAGRKLYVSYKCGTCHGKNGAEPVSTDYPLINGQNHDYLVRQMVDIMQGRRNNGNSQLMKAAIKGLTEAEMENIASFLSDL